MPAILDIVKDLPEELQSKFLLFYEAIREEILNTATKEDLAEVRDVLKELSLAQQKNNEAIVEL